MKKKSTREGLEALSMGDSRTSDRIRLGANTFNLVFRPLSLSSKRNHEFLLVAGGGGLRLLMCTCSTAQYTC